MAAPQDATFGTFADGGDLAINDIVVGLRNGINTRFNATGFPGIYLPLAGGVMAGAIDMNGNVITGLPAPVSATEAVNKAYADSLVTGAAMTEVNDTNVTLTLGGAPATSLLHAVSLTLGWTGQLAVPRGGTGAASFTAYGLICGGTTSTGALQNVSGLGTLNQVLVSQGAGALPQWASVPGLVPTALTEVNDTNVTMTLGGTPTTALLQAVSMTLGWTGQLSLARGGSNANLTAVNGGIVYSTASAMAISAAGSAGQILQSAGAATPVWTTATYPATAGASGNFMQSNGTNWASVAPAALTKTDDTNVTLTLGGSASVALMAAASLTLGWTGTLAATRGGTGLGTYVLGDTLYASAANTLSALAGNTTAVKQYLSQTGTGSASAAPVWATVSGSDITGAALTKTDDTNVTLTLGGTPATALLRAASLTLGWTGQLSVARGGTGLAAITAHYLPIGNGTSALTLLAPNATSGIPLISQGASADPAYGTAVVSGGGTGNTTFTAYSVLCAGTTATGAFQNVSGVGSAGQVLTSNGAAALPTWQNVAGTGTVSSGLINQIAWYAANGTTVSGLTTGNSGVLVTSSGGVPSIATGGQIPGTTTNNDANAGNIGEFISASVVQGSPVSVTTGTPANITSISLTAGDWDVWGTMATIPAGSTTTTFAGVGISTTTGTLPTLSPNAAYAQLAGLAVPAGNQLYMPVGVSRLSLSTTTTVYIVGIVGFAISTMGIFGFIAARRVR